MQRRKKKEYCGKHFSSGMEKKYSLGKVSFKRFDTLIVAAIFRKLFKKQRCNVFTLGSTRKFAVWRCRRERNAIVIGSKSVKLCLRKNKQHGGKHFSSGTVRNVLYGKWASFKRFKLFLRLLKWILKVNLTKQQQTRFHCQTTIKKYLLPKTMNWSNTLAATNKIMLQKYIEKQQKEKQIHDNILSQTCLLQ